MIRTLLVDDEPRGISTLKMILEQHCPVIEIIGTCNDAYSAKESIEKLKPELIFFDIAMPGKTSLELLQELDTINFEIIFVTAHNEYSIQAFKFSAIDYLLKPVDEDLVVAAVKRAETKIASGNINKNLETLVHNIQKNRTPFEMKLCIPSVKGFQVIQLEDVIYCEAEGGYTVFHLVNKQKVTASKSIIDYETLLENNDFSRIHKSFLINLHHVKEYHKGEGGTVLMTNNMEVEVSRRKKEFFVNQMKEKFRY